MIRRLTSERLNESQSEERKWPGLIRPLSIRDKLRKQFSAPDVES